MADPSSALKRTAGGYFIKDEETSYFIAENDPFYGIDDLMFQSVPKQEEPKKLPTTLTVNCG